MTLYYPPLDKTLTVGPPVYVVPPPPVERICKNCRFWERPAEKYSQGGRFGQCSSPKFLVGYDDYSSKEDDQVVVEGDEGWGFTTGPNFGCIHFAEKDAPEGEA